MCCPSAWKLVLACTARQQPPVRQVVCCRLPKQFAMLRLLLTSGVPRNTTLFLWPTASARAVEAQYHLCALTTDCDCLCRCDAYQSRKVGRLLTADTGGPCLPSCVIDKSGQCTKCRAQTLLIAGSAYARCSICAMRTDCETR